MTHQHQLCDGNACGVMMNGAGTGVLLQLDNLQFSESTNPQSIRVVLTPNEAQWLCTNLREAAEIATEKVLAEFDERMRGKNP